MLGKTESRKIKGRQRQDGWVASLTQRHEFEQGPGEQEKKGKGRRKAGRRKEKERNFLTYPGIDNAI